ncbi:unnamed protein product [Penicillium salamii]|uniref:Cytochrome b5 heme-binding domain-containing protein n=1 Tax=Penicillium salamii TaxID=1612424 RepID=A0A9W4J1T8_9EURO|nr:unnamed protein product [Penicillium salamii]
MLVSLFWVPVYKKTIQFMFIYGIIRGLCITAGYHRLWAHKAYSANSCLKLVFAVIGAGAGQGAIKTWCRDHRAHHRYVDTEQDPYSVQKGFFHAHIGWIIFKKDRSPSSTEATGRVDISDLKSDPIVEWQRCYYWQLLLLMGYMVPMAVCGLGWGDYLGGFVLAGCLGTSGVQQGTFCINSVAHWIGSQPYQTTKSPRDNFFAAFLTFGEGYHNFHHEFPIDYRNGIRWYDYDPTKWLIWLCGQFGFASNLRRFPYNEIQKGRIQGKQEKLRKESEMIDWGLPLAKLPTMKWEEYQEQSRTGCNLAVINGFVYDVSDFVTTHPGGASMLTEAIGKDATKMFEGGVYRHSNAARNLLDMMRMAEITA